MLKNALFSNLHQKKVRFYFSPNWKNAPFFCNQKLFSIFVIYAYILQNWNHYSCAFKNCFKVFESLLFVNFKMGEAWSTLGNFKFINEAWWTSYHDFLLPITCRVNFSFTPPPSPLVVTPLFISDRYGWCRWAVIVR